MFLGLIAGTAAGALWGLAFVAPLAIGSYTPFDLTIVRYLVFGLISLTVLAFRGFKAIRALQPREFVLLGALGFSGNVGFYLLLSMAISRAGPTVVTLVVGCLPVLIGLLGNREPQQIAPRHQIWPLMLIAVGLIVVNQSALQQIASAAKRHSFLGGLGLALLALLMWTWYGLTNARAIGERKTVPAWEWTALTGGASLIILIPLVPSGIAAGWSATTIKSATLADLPTILGWGIAVGGLSSWGATWAWSLAASRLPVALAGQLMVSETLFGLLYCALYIGRWPSEAEWIGAALLVSGVLMSIRAFQRDGVARTIPHLQ